MRDSECSALRFIATRQKKALCSVTSRSAIRCVEHSTIPAIWTAIYRWLNRKSRLLTQYASLINRVIEPFKASIFEILWAREHSGQGIATHRERLGQLILPILVQFTQTEFTQAEHFLSVYAQHLSAALASCDSLDRHPWAWIAKPLGFEEEERLLGRHGGISRDGTTGGGMLRASAKQVRNCPCTNDSRN